MVNTWNLLSPAYSGDQLPVIEVSKDGYSEIIRVEHS